MYKKNKKYPTPVSSSKMPSIFKKSTSDSGSLSESHRKVLHRCRMILLKDLDVSDILDYMSQEDGFKHEVRETIMSYPERERRVATLLDRLETRGDRAFNLFMEALRDHYKHLHYVLEENLRNVDDKDSKEREYKQSISGESIRKAIKSNIRRKADYSVGSDSVDDLDAVFEFREEDAYIDCYAIPFKGKLQKEKWIKQIKDFTPNCDEMDDEEPASYTAIVSRDLLFKRIEHNEIPVGVKKPPKQCSVFVIDNDNKYGMVKKERKVQVVEQARNSESSQNKNLQNVVKDNLLESQVSSELPDYTAPPPPSRSYKDETDHLQSVPPPPLPPKPGNLPPLGFRPINMKPKLEKDEIKEDGSVPSTSNPITENGLDNRCSDEDDVKPPPRSTSLVQSKIQQAKENQVDNKKDVSSPRAGSKFLVTKAIFEKGGSISPTFSSSSSEKSRPASKSPPVPPRQYLDSDVMVNGGLSGSGAIINDSVSEVSPTGEKKSFANTSSAVDNNNAPVKKADDVIKESEEGESSEDELGREVKVDSEDEFDPYSMGVDSIFQVRAKDPQEHVEANGDVAPNSKEDAQSSGTAETLRGSSTATLTRPESGDDDNDVDMNIPLQDDEYESVNVNDGKQQISSTSDAGNRSRESTPCDSEDAKRDSRDISSMFDSSFKASADSLISSTTPGSLGAQSITTDSGIDGLTSPTTKNPPLLVPQRTTSLRGPNQDSRPLPKDPPLPTSSTLAEVQVFADGDSSDTDSYYEHIDVLDKRIVPLIETSERTSVSYLDPKTYFKAIERMALQGHYKESTLKRIAIVEEWEASGRALVYKNELVVADFEEAYVLPPQAVNEDLDNNSRSPSPAAANAEDASSSMDNQINIDIYQDFRNTTIVYDKIGRAFYMPSQYMKMHGDPMGEPWFYPIEITSHQATHFLSAQKQEGCFLVYKPCKVRKNWLYNLSVCRGYKEVVHYHIVKNVHGDVMIEGHDHSFLNVIDLVHYFQRNKSQLATKLRRPLKEAYLPITPGYHYDLKWEISRTHLSISDKIIGKGTYGVVCSGTYHDNIPVAVKVLQKSDASIHEEDDFIDEAKCLMGLNHDHIVRFVGLSCTAKPFFLLYEYLPKGNLRECLQNNVVASDNIEQLFDVCVQITSAMTYLESQRYVLHRDLASRNFLVADDLYIKLGDFGRARFVIDDNYQAPKSEQIPVKWASPEVLLDSCYSTKSDVWALGIVFWEVLSGGQKPYSGLTGDQTAVYVVEGGRLEKPTGCPLDLYNLMFSCWRDSPHERPSFMAIYEKLKSKSSVYYSGPVRAEPALPKVKRKDGTIGPHSVKSPQTPSFSSSNKNKVQRSMSQNNKKVRHTVMIETTKTADTLPRELNSFDRDSRYQIRPLSGGSEKYGLSGSETSLNSNLQLPGMEDLTRGDKIRKSLRKIISMRHKRKSSNNPSKLDGVKEHKSYGADN